LTLSIDRLDVELQDDMIFKDSLDQRYEEMSNRYADESARNKEM